VTRGARPPFEAHVAGLFVPIRTPVERLTVECLSCGQQRILRRSNGRTVTADECPRCGYVGWAASRDVNETVRRLLRDLPVGLRRLAGPRAA
jgi:predicted RNA-binding Zn-ribbon protein involved in translation (DUF1610 family)